MTLNVIVADSAGLSAVSGGTLTDSTGASYGAFSTAGGQGTFFLTLTWAGVGAVSPVDAPAGGGQRPMTVTFFDNAGNTVQAPFVLSLACGDSSLSACDGRCVAQCLGCNGVVDCVAACIDSTCDNDCIAQGTSAAQRRYSAFKSCLDHACPSWDATCVHAATLAACKTPATDCYSDP